VQIVAIRPPRSGGPARAPRARRFVGGTTGQGGGPSRPVRRPLRLWPPLRRATRKQGSTLGSRGTPRRAARLLEARDPVRGRHLARRCRRDREHRAERWPPSGPWRPRVGRTARGRGRRRGAVRRGVGRWGPHAAPGASRPFRAPRRVPRPGTLRKRGDPAPLITPPNAGPNRRSRDVGIIKVIGVLG
jgi:hypothetical protein